jgi:hypothetical protein
VELPHIDDIPTESIADAARILEAMVAGLRSNPPDSFVDDWTESVEEGERLLEEIRQKADR